MYKYFFVLISIFHFNIAFANTIEKKPITNIQTSTIKNITVTDSSALKEQKRVLDSLNQHFIALKSEIATKNPILDSLMKIYYHDKLNKNYRWNNIPQQVSKKPILLNVGKKRYQGENWLLVTLSCLLFCFIVFKKSFEEDFKVLATSFFKKNSILKLSQKQSLFSSLGFFFFFILFVFILSLYLYLSYSFLEDPLKKHSFYTFINLSFYIFLLYLLKIILLKSIDIFTKTKAIHEYISFVYLSYFNTALAISPILILFILSPMKYGYICSLSGMIVVSIIFSILLLRLIRNTFNNKLISILYLLLYFCTLEICPIIFLTKWLS